MNANKYLRFGCVLDTAHPEDKLRHFILKYSLADGTLSLNEPPIRNSGIQGGKFLSSQLVVKPGCDLNVPEYYTSKDFYIGCITCLRCWNNVFINKFCYRCDADYTQPSVQNYQC